MNKKLFGLLVGLSLGAGNSVLAMEEPAEEMKDVENSAPHQNPKEQRTARWYLDMVARFTGKRDPQQALYNAINHDNDTATQELLYVHGAKANVANSLGWTSLHYAAENGNAKIVKILLKAGALVKAKDKQGQTPLHFAARQGSVAVVDLLLKAGADVYAEGYHHITPLEMAKYHHHEEVVNLLKAADPHPIQTWIKIFLS